MIDGTREGQGSDSDFGGDPFYAHALRELRGVARRVPAEVLADKACASAVGLMDVQGASLTAQYTPTMSVPVGASDPTAAAAEQAQFTCGQGPCMHALSTGALSLITDLEAPEDTGRQRWPTYSLLLARASNYRCVLAVPVPPQPHPWPRARHPSTALGLPVALTVYRRDPLISANSTVAEASTALGTALSTARSVSAAISVVLGEVPAAGRAARPWLDSGTAQVRAWVWRAEELLQRADGSLSRPQALTALRTYAVIHGLTIDEAAEMLVTGHLMASDIRGRP